MNFGALDPECAAYDSALFVVIPVPYDLTSTYQPGSRQGPGAILAASANMELYDEELGKSTYRQGIYTAPPVEVDARGPEHMMVAIRRVVADVLRDDKIPVLLGGEHSVTLGAVQAVKAAFPGLQTLQLDAHADLRESYQGTPYSHACIARRIQELCPLVQAGIRSMSEEEASFCGAAPSRPFPPTSSSTTLTGPKRSAPTWTGMSTLPLILTSWTRPACRRREPRSREAFPGATSSCCCVRWQKSVKFGASTSWNCRHFPGRWPLISWRPNSSIGSWVI